MKSVLRELQSMNAVGAGQVANLSVPTGGPTYKAFYFEYLHTASTKANEAKFGTDIETVKVKINGDALWDITGQELLDINNYYGYSMVDGYFPLFFARPEFLNPAEEDNFSLGTLGGQKVSVEVKIASGATAPELKMYSVLAYGQQRNLGQLIRVRGTSYGTSISAGEFEIHDLPVKGPEPGRGVKAIHVKSGNVGSHEILLNGQTISESTAELQGLFQDHEAFQTVSRNPVANYHHIDFTGNRYSGIVPMTNVADFRMKLNFTGAEASGVRILHEEVIGQRDR